MCCFPQILIFFSSLCWDTKGFPDDVFYGIVFISYKGLLGSLLALTCFTVEGFHAMEGLHAEEGSASPSHLSLALYIRVSDSRILHFMYQIA